MLQTDYRFNEECFSLGSQRQEDWLIMESFGLKQKRPEMNVKMGMKTNSKIKSSLCRNFMEFGNCQYGSKCQFAHGTHELRCNTENQMSYKTRICYAFDKKTYCTYGKRCNFIHQQSEEQSSIHIKDYREIIYEVRAVTRNRIQFTK